MRIRECDIHTLYLDDLDDSWYFNPRRRMSKAIDAYIGDGPIKRPLFALHRLAVFSEHRLADIRAIRGIDMLSVSRAESFFITVRSAQRRVYASLDTEALRYKPNEIRRMIRGLLPEAREINEIAHKKVAVCRCPFCLGRGRMPKNVERVCRRIIRDAIEKGVLPDDFFG